MGKRMGLDGCPLSLIDFTLLLVANPRGAPVSPYGDPDAYTGEATAVRQLAEIEGCLGLALRQDAHRQVRD